MYSGYGHGSLIYVAEVPGTGIEVLQNSQKFRVDTRMWHPYPYPHPGMFTRVYPYPGCQDHTELTEVPGTGNTRETTPGIVMYVPYRTQPCKFW